MPRHAVDDLRCQTVSSTVFWSVVLNSDKIIKLFLGGHGNSIVSLFDCVVLMIGLIEALFIEVKVDLKFRFSPLIFSFAAFYFQGFYHYGVSPRCFLFAQSFLDFYWCINIHGN